MVSDGTEFAVGDIERLFDEARRDKKAKHEKWEKYYNRRRRDVQIKKGQSEETVMPSTSGYNLRRRKGTKVESRPTIQMKTQQVGPVRARNSREKHYSPDMKDQERSGSKNTRRRGCQQQNGKEKKGGENTNRSISLNVLVGDVNYKSEKSGCIVSFYILSNKWSEELL
ncbi:uncharacterized protein TNCV_2034181 [Trichonephila clavipes]|nr:uncharacterized protein TNCV_2034181 [Trichonephila clavipes]